LKTYLKLFYQRKYTGATRAIFFLIFLKKSKYLYVAIDSFFLEAWYTDNISCFYQLKW